MNPAPATSGTGHLRIERVCGQSAATSVRAVSPLKIMVPRPRGPAVWACLSNLGGGLVAGDQIALTLELGARARAFVTTQASTKLYPDPHARRCTQDLRVRLDAESLLVLFPDPVQAFADSLYRQHQRFWLAPQSGLVLVDWLSSGRWARGERWAFRRFQSCNEIWSGESRLLVDSLLLDPAHGPLDAPYRMGRFNCLALVLVIGEPLRDHAARLLEASSALPMGPQEPVICSASPIANGALVRLAGRRLEAVAQQVHHLLDFLPALLDDIPWVRKW